MKCEHLIGVFMSILALTGIACRLSVVSRPALTTPTSLILQPTAIHTPAPDLQPTEAPLWMDHPGNGKVLFLPLLARGAEAADPPVGGTVPVLGAPAPVVSITGPPAGRLTQPNSQPPVEPEQIAIPGAPPRPAVYHLKRGEFPYCLARRYNIHPQDLMAFNGFSFRQIFSPGQVVRLPQNARPFPGQRTLRPYPTLYTVRPGDSVYSIACDFGDLDPQVLLQANAPVDRLKAGMKLIIPGPGAAPGLPSGRQAAVSVPTSAPTAVQAGGILPLTGNIPPETGGVPPAASDPTLPPVTTPEALPTLTADAPNVAKTINSMERLQAASGAGTPLGSGLPALPTPIFGGAGPTAQAPEPVTPVVVYLPFVEAGRETETITPDPRLALATPPLAKPMLPPFALLPAPPTLAPLPIPTATATPPPTATPNPTRPVTLIYLPQANVDLSTLQIGAPAGLLHPEITYTIFEGSSPVNCPSPETIVVEANDLPFRSVLPPMTYEINMLLNLYSCGWNPGEMVTLDVQYPDGRVYRQDPQPPEDEQSRNASGSGRVTRLFNTRLSDPPGVYTFILRGAETRREFRFPIYLQAPAGPRARAEFQGGDNRTNIIGFTLYGFYPNETLRVVAYRVDSLEMRGQLVGWQSLQADLQGRLYVAVNPAQFNIDYQFIGDQSGQALVSFSRVGLPGAIR